jgi:uncharacterized protein YecT (DUF1311 family)
VHHQRAGNFRETNFFLSMRYIGLTLTCLVLMAPARLWADDPKIIPAKWQPELSQAIDWSTANLKEAMAQMQMNSLSRQIADMKDAQLFVLYVRLYERLGAKEREQLLAGQTKWLKARIKAARDAVESEGGSLAAFESNNAESEFTDRRIKELNARLANTKKKRG